MEDQNNIGIFSALSEKQIEDIKNLLGEYSIEIKKIIVFEKNNIEEIKDFLAWIAPYFEILHGINALTLYLSFFFTQDSLNNGNFNNNDSWKKAHAEFLKIYVTILEKANCLNSLIKNETLCSFVSENSLFKEMTLTKETIYDTPFRQIYLYRQIDFIIDYSTKYVRRIKEKTLFTKQQLIFMVRHLTDPEHKKLNISAEDLFELLAPYCYIAESQKKKARGKPILSENRDIPELKKLFESGIKKALDTTLE